MLYNPKHDLDADSLTLLRAADIIDKDGWCKGQMRNKEGANCLRDAIAEASGRLVAQTTAEQRLMDYVAEKYNQFWKFVPHVPHLNDSFIRNKDEAVTLLREAAMVPKTAQPSSTSACTPADKPSGQTSTCQLWSCSR